VLPVPPWPPPPTLVELTVLAPPCPPVEEDEEDEEDEDVLPDVPLPPQLAIPSRAMLKTRPDNPWMFFIGGSL
jgi:hypothetical protein